MSLDAIGVFVGVVTVLLLPLLIVMILREKFFIGN